MSAAAERLRAIVGDPTAHGGPTPAYVMIPWTDWQVFCESEAPTIPPVEEPPSEEQPPDEVEIGEDGDEPTADDDPSA